MVVLNLHYSQFVIIIQLCITTCIVSLVPSAGPRMRIISRKQLYGTSTARYIALLVSVRSNIWEYWAISHFSFPLLKIIHCYIQPSPCLSIHDISELVCYYFGIQYYQYCLYASHCRYCSVLNLKLAFCFVLFFVSCYQIEIRDIL